MRWRNLQWALGLGLGAVLGFGVATYRNFLPEPEAVASAPEGQKGGPKKEEHGGVFSPPGTFEDHVKDIALWGAAGQPCPN